MQACLADFGKNRSTSLMHSKTFDDFDAFSESVREVECRMMLRDIEQREWKISSVGLGSFGMQLGQLGSGNIAQGQSRQDGYMAYVPLSSGVEYLANGQAFNEDSFVVMDQGCEFCFSTQAAHNWSALFIPNSYANVEQLASIVQVRYTGERTCHLSHPGRPTMDRLRDAIREVMVAVREHPRFESTQAAKNAAAELFDCVTYDLHASLQSASATTGREKTPRQQVIRQSLEHLDSRSLPAVRVRDLVAATGVSERTLRAVFHEYYGVGPARYIQLRHLNQIRCDLKKARPEESTVFEILVNHGEWAFSRFATRYRKLFGELPSETLRNNRL